MKLRSAMWRATPLQQRIYQGIVRRMAPHATAYFAGCLASPIFVVGFNNGCKSTIVNHLQREFNICLYPDEGNQELWFPGFFPWAIAQPNVAPIWYDPETFLAAALSNRKHGFQLARAYLGAYQYLLGAESIILDSGMIGGLLPDVLPTFPDARFIHVIRDGRVASYLSARREWSLMMRSPARYMAKGCSLEFDDVLGRMAHYWAWMCHRIEQVREQVPDQYHEIRYEDLARNPESVMSKLADFIGETGKPLSVGKAGIIDDLNDLVMRHISARDLAIMENVAGDVLGGYGYNGSV